MRDRLTPLSVYDSQDGSSKNRVPREAHLVSRATVRLNHSVLRFTRKSGVSVIAAETFMKNVRYAPAFLDIAYPIT